jgi:hypothetical protein
MVFLPGKPDRDREESPVGKNYRCRRIRRITSPPEEGEKPMDLSEIQENYPEISAAANEVLALPGPGFTHKPGGHVETDISAAASLAGLLILRGRGIDLSRFTPGTVILSDMDTEMDEIWNFMTAAAGKMGLDPSDGWDGEIPEAHKPLFPIPEMTQKIENGFLHLCSRHNLKKAYFPYVAVLAALKLVYAADRMHILDQKIGKALTGYHVVAGAKTVPYP